MVAHGCIARKQLPDHDPNPGAIYLILQPIDDNLLQNTSPYNLSVHLVLSDLIRYVIIIPTQFKTSPVRLCQNSNGSVPYFVGKVKQTSPFSVTRRCRFVVFRTTISSCAHFVKRIFSDNHYIFRPFSMLQNNNCVYLADELYATCRCILLPDRPRKRPPLIRSRSAAKCRAPAVLFYATGSAARYHI